MINYYKNFIENISNKEKEIIEEFIKILNAEQNPNNIVFDSIKNDSIKKLETFGIDIKNKGKESSIEIEGELRTLKLLSSEGYLSIIFQIKKDKAVLEFYENLIFLDVNDKNFIEIEKKRDIFFIESKPEPKSTLEYIIENLKLPAKEIIDTLALKEDKSFPDELITFIEQIQIIDKIYQNNKKNKKTIKIK